MKKSILLIILLLSFSLVGCQVLGENSNETVGTKPEIENGKEKDSEGLPLETNSNNLNDQVVSNPETNPDQSNDQTVNNPVTNPNQSHGITVNNISFSQISEEKLSEQIIQSIEKNKGKRGYTAFPNNDGSYLLVIYAGEKSSGGHGIEVISIEDNEGITNILVEETKPRQGDMVITVITYPYTIVSFSGTTDNFKIVNSEGKVLTEIK